LIGDERGVSVEIAVVTGANRGIGLEVARQLAERGLEVVLASRDLAKGETAARALGLGNVHARRLDVASEESVGDFAAGLKDEYPRLDVLVNNAAILYDTWAHARDADLAVVHQAFETNLFGAWRTVQALLPLLQRSGNARIVNVSSEGGSLASMHGGTPAYSVSKAALNALTRVLAAELPTMRINAVCPGWTATDMGGPGGRPVEQGAASVVWAATLAADGPTGGFFRDGRPLPW
jgi:NAD(P)-dependent dehydrogenase (short-subunit alcohol dehydrogenase family)